MQRRNFITYLSLVTGSLALAGTALGRRSTALTGSRDIESYMAVGYGDLFPTAAKNTGETYIALPKGFEYDVIGIRGSIMSDGRPTPSAHDGMFAFKSGREVRIVRNHEVSNRGLPVEGAAIGSKFHYDETCGGGTTTLVIDNKANRVVRDFVSLSGTLINCAGGPTPWGSWISCEETTLGPTVRTNSRGVKSGGFPKPHGYCFEVPASANSEVPAVPLKAMGRFEHEAVSVDAKSGVVYLTEDYRECGLYRFLPKRNKRLAEGGTLQMLSVTGKPEYDTRTGQTTGATFDAEWVTIDDPDPESADIDPSAVFKQGKAKGGATFARLEGCQIDRQGTLFFTATSGGDKRGGQIWSYRPNGKDRGTLQLVFQSPDKDVLFMPDNVCLLPKSKLLFVCEDRDYSGIESINHVRVLTPEGKMAPFVRNVSSEYPRSEFAGTTFSPDGRTLFVNLQLAGVTFAIRGDWSKFRS